MNLDFDRDKIVSLALENFNLKKSDILLNADYLLEELSQVQSRESIFKDFDEAFLSIRPEMSVKDAAYILGKIERVKIEDVPHAFLESLKKFCEIEAKIRFSLWPEGINSPHHFSKLLLTPKVRNLFSQKKILCILAIFADPKGLNKKNIAAHGFSFDASLSLQKKNGISHLILPKLPKYRKKTFDFAYELSLLEFHRFRLNIPENMELEKFSPHFFLLLDENRIKSLEKAYELYYSEKYVDSLLLLLPILEHSIRRAAVSMLNLSHDHLCASSDEHFLSIPEALEAFPKSLRNMTTDLLFSKKKPRIRDKIMHGAIKTKKKEFAYCIFLLLEKCNKKKKDNEEIGNWNYAFHPKKKLEFELSKSYSLPSLEKKKIYNSQTFERLIESAKALQKIKNIWKNSDIHEIFQKNFQRFIVTCILYFSIGNVKNGTLQHLSGLIYAVIKLESTNDVERLKKAFETRIKSMKSHLPFIKSEHQCSFNEIINIINLESLIDDAINEVNDKITSMM
ncbi:hypothetical protein TRFO_30693 [Tritrichomonas foetus]|uniref:DUF4209 domain-containing protein n=1 Tax=Tritrichomonas foetus TaxID=1144522 RepID=A0A1J4JUW3_9EUKA|nr:hypothetical protein TRFO_30693 [Tritrichomonas foetus]|eukprot:OHT02232.1 hypothetical protein TRFO_30693 [Tritrichomonas foetus]